MTTARRNHLTADYIRSPFISERRRKLFPTEDYDMDSELGHISPIRSDDTSESDDDCDAINRTKTKTVHGSGTPMSNRTCSETMSPLKLSPCSSGFLTETFKRFSPSQNLKTPHDTSTKPVLEKEQKTLLEESKSLKRKGSSPYSSPEQSKSFKSDVKSSKVRTALFPPESPLDNMALPTKSFYSKNQASVLKKINVPKANHNYYKPVKFNAAKLGCRQGRKLGTINNGVRHNIRKPRQKKLSKTVMAKSTKKMLAAGSALNEYILDLSELKKKQLELIQHPGNKIDPVVEDPEIAGYLKDVKKLENNEVVKRKQISSPPKQFQALTEENKENVNVLFQKRSSSSPPCSPEDKKTRKFFKNSRAKPVISKKQNILLDNENHPKEEQIKKFAFPIVASPETEEITLDSNSDFEDDTEPEANIDNILSALSAESPQKKWGNHIGQFAGNYGQSTGENNTQIHDSLPAINKNVNSDHFSVQLSINADTSHIVQDCDFTTQGTQTNNIHHLSSDLDKYPKRLKFKDDASLLNRTETHHNEQLIPAVNPLITLQEAEISPRIILEAHNSVMASENSIQLHQPSIANMILSPISQMCDVTSGLALNSPRKGRDVTSLLCNMSRASKMLSFNGDCHSVDMEEQRKKLFPIFYKGANAQIQENVDRGEKRERGEGTKRSAKRFKTLPSDQMLLDAGQKKFGLTLCNECNIVYHMGDPNDEIQHLNYHNAHHILRFAGWKNEHLVTDFQNRGRIIRVLPTDSKIWIKKIKELMEVVKRDLGCYEMEYDISQSEVYLYIKNRTIAGCTVATAPKEEGHKMLSSVSGVAMCSEEAYPIKCGISHIWVASNFRKQGIASALLDAVKTHFIYGYILSNDDIALTSPTEAGSAFAEKYFKTPNYLIYYT